MKPTSHAVRDGEHHIEFEIVFDEPARVSQYCEELDRLQKHIPNLESNR